MTSYDEASNILQVLRQVLFVHRLDEVALVHVLVVLEQLHVVDVLARVVLLPLRPDDNACRVILYIGNPWCLSQIESHDMASIICQALPPARA